MQWFRFADASAAVRALVPAGLTPLAHAATLLGSPTGLMILLALAYWIGERRAWRYIISLAFVALALVVAAKAGFALPRPPVDVRRIAVDGYGFPSGHAVAATVAYGGAALFVKRLRSRAGTALAVVLVAVVALSRVALGVHYLGDVLAGVLLGAAVLAVVPAVVNRDARYAFALAVALSPVAFVFAGASDHVLLTAGGALGGLAGTVAFPDPPAPRSTVETLVLVAVGLASVGAVHEAAGALGGPAVAAVDALLVFGIVAMPAALNRATLARVASFVGGE